MECTVRRAYLDGIHRFPHQDPLLDPGDLCSRDVERMLLVVLRLRNLVANMCRGDEKVSSALARGVGVNDRESRLLQSTSVRDWRRSGRR